MTSMRDVWKKIRKGASTLAALVLIGIVAGPEFLLSMELIALLSAMGAGLFFFSFGGAQVRYACGRLTGGIERIDPFFFISSVAEVRVAPGLAAHAVPFFVVMLVSGVVAPLWEIIAPGRS